MAALETPWMSSMSDVVVDPTDGTVLLGPGETPTFAPFTPASISSLPNQRSTILIHQKSPLLLATPPQITRALAYSYPFLHPLNKLLGLLSWSTDDPWASFLLVAGFWAVTMYGDAVLRYAGPLILVVALILAMYTRRFSPLSTNSINSSSTNKATPSHSRQNSEAVGHTTSITVARHHKSLDDVLVTLQTFTARCNILLEPFVLLVDFLSTQRTATSSTTGPALTTLFIRILLLTPFWYALTIPSLHILTTRRLILVFGTILLSWHSPPARISRIILWRSRFVRRACHHITGLTFSNSSMTAKIQDANTKSSRALARSASNANLASKSNKNGRVNGSTEAIRFTFSLYENQRRWLGIGWTSSMLAYERASWTDEELNPTPPKEAFELPSVGGGVAVWRWCDDASDADDDDDDGWRVEIEPEVTKGKRNGNTSPPTAEEEAKLRESAWIYTDTKWRYPRRGQDGWGKYTRRRKWVRDAELVDSSGIVSVSDSTATLRGPRLAPRPKSGIAAGITAAAADTSSAPATPSSSPSKKGGWFTRRKATSKEANGVVGSLDDAVLSAALEKDKDKLASGARSISSSVDTSLSIKDGDDNDDYIPLRFRGRQGALEADWGVGEDVGMDLG